MATIAGWLGATLYVLHASERAAMCKVIQPDVRRRHTGRMSVGDRSIDRHVLLVLHPLFIACRELSWALRTCL